MLGVHVLLQLLSVGVHADRQFLILLQPFGKPIDIVPVGIRYCNCNIHVTALLSFVLCLFYVCLMSVLCLFYVCLMSVLCLFFVCPMSVLRVSAPQTWSSIASHVSCS